MRSFYIFVALSLLFFYTKAAPVADSQQSSLETDTNINLSNKDESVEQSDITENERFYRTYNDGTVEFKTVLSNGHIQYQRISNKEMDDGRMIQVYEGYTSQRYTDGRYGTSYYIADENGYRSSEVKVENNPPQLPSRGPFGMDRPSILGNEIEPIGGDNIRIKGSDDFIQSENPLPVTSVEISSKNVNTLPISVEEITDEISIENVNYNQNPFLPNVIKAESLPETSNFELNSNISTEDNLALNEPGTFKSDVLIKEDPIEKLPPSGTEFENSDNLNQDEHVPTVEELLTRNSENANKMEIETEDKESKYNANNEETSTHVANDISTTSIPVIKIEVSTDLTLTESPISTTEKIEENSTRITEHENETVQLTTDENETTVSPTSEFKTSTEELITSTSSTTEGTGYINANKNDIKLITSSPDINFEISTEISSTSSSVKKTEEKEESVEKLNKNTNETDSLSLKENLTSSSPTPEIKESTEAPSTEVSVPTTEGSEENLTNKVENENATEDNMITSLPDVEDGHIDNEGSGFSTLPPSAEEKCPENATPLPVNELNLNNSTDSVEKTQIDEAKTKVSLISGTEDTTATELPIELDSGATTAATDDITKISDESSTQKMLEIEFSAPVIHF